MTHNLKKLFDSIIDINNEENNDNDNDYKLINNMDDLIKGSHIRFKISSKTRYSGFFVMYKKSLVRDYNMVIIKINKDKIEIPFYKYKVYQKDLHNMKKKSVFASKDIREKYLNNLSKYLNRE